MIQPHKLNPEQIVRTAIEAAAFANGYDSAYESDELRAEDWDDLIDISALNLTSMGVDGYPVNRASVIEALDWNQIDDDYAYRKIS